MNGNKKVVSFTFCKTLTEQAQAHIRRTCGAFYQEWLLDRPHESQVEVTAFAKDGKLVYLVESIDLQGIRNQLLPETICVSFHFSLIRAA